MKKTEEIELTNETKTTLLERIKQLVRFDDKNLLNNLPYLLLIAVLGVLHVANNHLVENKVREINSLEKEIKEYRWMYMTTKSELMFKSKQSEVAEAVEEMGLKELKKPPFKIEMEIEE